MKRSITIVISLIVIATLAWLAHDKLHFMTVSNPNSDPFSHFSRWVDYTGHTDPDATEAVFSALNDQAAPKMEMVKAELNGQTFRFSLDSHNPAFQTLNQDDKAALLYYWPKSSRSVLIEGLIMTIPAKTEKATYYRLDPSSMQFYQAAVKSNSKDKNNLGTTMIYTKQGDTWQYKTINTKK